MINDEYSFKLAIKILKENNIHFWLCHGTLLGAIRENRLLPWDHDIDIGIWSDQHSKNQILNIFKNEQKFKQTIVPEETDNLHFLYGSKRVDINFYKKNSEIAYIKWIAPGNKINRFLFVIGYFIYGNASIKASIEASSLYAKTLKIALIFLFIPFRFLLSNNIKINIKNLIKSRTNYTGYSYPMELMKFKNFNFLGEVIPIPIKSEEVLEMTYGKDWKVQKKNFVWHKEAKNLLSQNEVDS